MNQRDAKYMSQGEADRLRRNLEDRQDELIRAKGKIYELHEMKTASLKRASIEIERIRNGHPHTEITIETMKTRIAENLISVDRVVDEVIREIDRDIKRLDAQIDECRAPRRSSSNPYGSVQKSPRTPHLSGWRSY